MFWNISSTFKILSLFLLFLLPGCGCSSTSGAPAQTTAAQSKAAISKPDKKGVGTVSPGGSSVGGVVGATGGSSSTDEGERLGKRPVKDPSRQDGDSSGEQSQTPPPISPTEYRKNFKPREFEEFADLRGYDEVRSIYEPGSDFESVKRGEKVFVASCRSCHTPAGEPVRTTPAMARANIPYLTNPADYKYGAAPKAIFRTLKYGTSNPAKGQFGSVLSDQDLWDVVFYVISLHDGPSRF